MGQSFSWKCVFVWVICFYFLNIQFLTECLVLKNRFASNTSDILILTPFIENGQLAEARMASEVNDLPVIGNSLRSYSGYFTVNSTYNSNLFFWFFPPLNGDPDCPVLLWLEGGPGMASTFSLFVENGPIQVDINGTPSLRNYTWNREFAVLYIDNPVGTGFSFTDNDLGYSRDQTEISRNLYSALQQFFLVFSEYRDNPFFLTGYSYACKYIVTLANLIHESNNQNSNSMRIDLRALSIGNPFCNLRLEDNYADYLHQVGLIDQNDWRNLSSAQNELNHLIDTQQYLSAFQLVNRLFLPFIGLPYVDNVTGINVINILRDFVDYDSMSYFFRYIETPETRRAIHVGAQRFDNGSRVMEVLEQDIPQSVSPAIETILNRNYPTLFYDGNADMIVNPASVENLLTNLVWNGSTKFNQASQHIYRMTNDTVTGYVRQADNLYYMVVRNAGHVVPYDQPAVALNMITRFVRAIADCTNCVTNETSLF